MSCHCLLQKHASNPQNPIFLRPLSVKRAQVTCRLRAPSRSSVLEYIAREVGLPPRVFSALPFSSRSKRQSVPEIRPEARSSGRSLSLVRPEEGRGLVRSGFPNLVSSPGHLAGCLHLLEDKRFPSLGSARSIELLSHFTGPPCPREVKRLPVEIKAGPTAAGARLAPVTRRASTALKEKFVMGKGEAKQKGTARTIQTREPPSAGARNSSCFIQVMGTGMDTGDTAPSVLLFFDQLRFVFNAGEGLQRFCIEHKIRLAKIDQIFLTRVCSETAGGLPGLLLTLANTDAGRGIKVSGPSNLQHLVGAIRTFVPGAAVVNAQDFDQSSSGRQVPPEQVAPDDGLQIMYADELVKIRGATLIPDSKAQSPPASPEGLADPFWVSPPGESEQKRQRVTAMEALINSRGRQQPSGSAAGTAMPGGESEPGIRPADLSMVYVCELAQIPGKFDPERARKLGLKPSKKYGELQKGQSVKSDDGKRMILPKDVMDEPSPGPVVLLVDCPTPGHVAPLVSALGLRRFCKGGGAEVAVTDQVTCVVHLGHQDVVLSQPYQDWMASLGKQAHHILAGHGQALSAPPVLAASATLMAKLHLICPQAFTIAALTGNHWSAQKTSAPGNSATWLQEAPSAAEVGPVTVAQNLIKFQLRPLAGRGLDRTAVPPPVQLEEFQKTFAEENPDVMLESRKVARLWHSMALQLSARAGVEASVDSRSASPVMDSDSLENDASQQPEKALAMELGWEQSAAPGSQVAAVEVLTQLDGPSDMHVEDEPVPPCDLPPCLRGVGRREMEIVFLGTGSSQPSKYRNVSAIHVDLFERGGVLLDCGEGTYAQLKRRYGDVEADAAIAKLSFVWISHIHADHHAGLARILAVRKRLLEAAGALQPIVVVGPKPLRRYLEVYDRLEDLQAVFLDCSQTTEEADMSSDSGADAKANVATNAETAGVSQEVVDGRASLPNFTPMRARLIGMNPSPGGSLGQGDGRHGHGLRAFWLQGGINLKDGVDSEGKTMLAEALAKAGLARLLSVRVVHCPHAFGVVLEALPLARGAGGDLTGQRTGWKVVYSGDTRPCQALVDASRGATVLIHEATFDDGMPEEAVAKRHSLTCEAVGTGIAAGAYRTILTHFSQRYPKIPVFDDSFSDRTCIAFDMMSANLADLPLLPSLLPALKLLFKDQFMDEEAAEEGAAAVVPVVLVSEQQKELALPVGAPR